MNEAIGGVIYLRGIDSCLEPSSVMRGSQGARIVLFLMGQQLNIMAIPMQLLIPAVILAYGAQNAYLNLGNSYSDDGLCL